MWINLTRTGFFLVAHMHDKLSKSSMHATAAEQEIANCLSGLESGPLTTIIKQEKEVE